MLHFAEDGAECDGNCLNDIDEDGICDEAELPGCADPLACNYSQLATDDNGTCFFAADGQDCDGNCLSDLDGDGVCDGDEVEGCADEAACNYDPAVTNPDGSCTPTSTIVMATAWPMRTAMACVTCWDSRLYLRRAAFSLRPPMTMAPASLAGMPLAAVSLRPARYDPAATVDDGCHSRQGLDCNGDLLLDCDGDGICDANEIPGCTDAAACNYLPGATTTSTTART